MKFIKEYSWAGVLGFSFSVAGWDFTNWRFYVAIITISILVEWSKS